MTSIEIVIPTASTFSVPTILCTTEISKLSAVDMSVFLYFSLRNGILHGLFDVFVFKQFVSPCDVPVGEDQCHENQLPGCFRDHPEGCAVDGHVLYISVFNFKEFSLEFVSSLTSCFA